MKKIHVSFCIIIFLFIATLIICINYSSASAKDFNEYKNLLKQTLANENWQEMNRISDDVIKFYPDNDFGYFFKGIAMDELGEYEKAISYYTKALEIKPNLPDIFQNRGLAYYHNKQYDEAIADYKKALELNPNFELAKEQIQVAINAKKGIVVSKNGNVTNYQSVNDPFYLVSEYKNMPKSKKKEIINSVKNSSSDILPIYYIAVSEDVYSNNNKLAAYLYVLGRYRTIQDVAVCKDNSAAQAISALPFVAPKTSQYISKMDKKDLAKLLQKVLDWDEKHPNRPEPKWICYHGMEVFMNNGNVTTVSQKEWDTRKDKIKQSVIKYIEELQEK